MASSISLTIDRADAAAGSLLSRMQRLVEQTQGLTDSQRQSLPVFRGGWQSSRVEDYLGRLQEAVRTPVVYQSRQLLQTNGIPAEGVPAEILEDGPQVQRLVQLLNDLGPLGHHAKPLVARWLMDAARGLPHAVKRLAELDKSELEDVSAVSIPKELKDSYLRSVIEGGQSNVSATASALAAALALLKDYRVKVSHRKHPVADLESRSRQLIDNIEQLEDLYSLPRAKVITVIKSKDLDQALQATSDAMSVQALELQKLTDVWRSLSEGLASVGESPREQPRSLDAMRRRTTEMEQRLEELIGSPGRRLLDYLRDVEEFPKDLDLADIQKGLEALRPLIMRGTRKP